MADVKGDAELLVAWSGWRWRPGMRDWTHDRGVDVDDGGFVFFVEILKDGVARIEIEDVPDAVPDLSHVGTVELVLGLARGAWKDPTLHIVIVPRPGHDVDVMWAVWRWAWSTSRPLLSQTYKTRAKAAVAACLGAS